MKYLVDVADEDDYRDITSDTFNQEFGFIIFFNYFRDMDGRVVEGAVTKVAAFPAENVVSIVAQGDETLED